MRGRRTYRQLLLVRWSRRDKLTVGIIAVTSAFLVGATLLLLAMSSQTAAVAFQYTNSMSVSHYDDLSAAEDAASPSDIVLPTATVTVNGSESRVVGVPDSAPTVLSELSVSWKTARIPPPPQDGFVKGSVAEPRTRQFEGSAHSVRLQVVPYTDSDSIFPHSWYVGTPSTVRSLGVDGAFVVHTDGSGGGLQDGKQAGTMSPSLFPYFLTGIQGIVHVLLTVTIGASILIIIVLYNVTKMSVRNRLSTIQLIRSTGGTPRQILMLFGIRAGMIALVGVLLGYAIGVVVTRFLVNAVVYAGVPISLNPTVTAESIRVIAPIFFGFVFVGAEAGVAAAWPTVTQSPANLTTSERTPIQPATNTTHLGRLRAAFTTTLLNWRAIVPATTTLTIFALIILLSGSLVGALAPLASSSSGTVSEPGAPYPMASRIDAQYASVLRSQGLVASPEILLVQVKDGKPFLVRGAEYAPFAAVSEASLIRGREPNSKYEAVIGRDLAATLDIGIGDSITIGGSTSPSMTRVAIIGMYQAPGMLDDQLVVPLPTAHDLSTKPGTVQFIRTAGGTPNLSQSGAVSDTGIAVTGIKLPTSVTTQRPIPVEVDVQNFETTEQTRRLTVRAGKASESRVLTLGPNQQRRITIPIEMNQTGTHVLRVGSQTRRITVYRQLPLSLATVPDAAPPDAVMAVPVTTVDGAPVSGASVQLGEQTVQTNDRGIAPVQIPSDSGSFNLTASKGNRTQTKQLTVSTDATQTLVATIDVHPKVASVYSRPTAEVTVLNPWSREFTRQLTVVNPSGSQTRTVTLAPRNVSTLDIRVGRMTPITGLTARSDRSFNSLNFALSCILFLRVESHSESGNG
ncbi:FtsX-like permease family protein [Haladaptatus sp. NG-SE-30]